MSKVKRIYVEKKEPFAIRAKELKEELINYLDIDTLQKVRVLARYDVENISMQTYEKALGTVFSEPPIDYLFEETFPCDKEDKVFTLEYLPGQFDQRADSAKQCVKLLDENEEPIIKTAITYVLTGDIDEEKFRKIKTYCINPVDSREAGEKKPDTLESYFEEPADVSLVDGFISMKEDQLEELYQSLNLAMTFKDFCHIQNYFRDEEKREPFITEIRVLDTYWSDHCRHTTFLTELKEIEIGEGFYQKPILDAYNKYLEDRNILYKGREDKYISLMDIALIAMKKLRAEGKLEDMEVSDEINACSIVVPVEIDGIQEEWLVFFKNETHNHPTEIEPFGGAATCLGGAIRDPLSGRGYVYQAMRVTGAADPNIPIKDTLEGKLPQRKIVTGAARGYSSYGNQIGLATGLVDEIYHPNYAAKRMEIGAVMGAAPRKNVIREKAELGDKIILLGGRTGRDGIGGATGSSKVHTTESIENCGAEVQKGNAPTERKLQRLFRREEVSRLIKKCNDFGAGGVSVAIGELADGLNINLDKVPKKYAGLDGTELAISESQERMAVVVNAADVEKMLSFADEENLEAVVVAEVTKEPRLVMNWRGTDIVNISRAFLDTNGAHQEARAFLTMPEEKDNYFNKENFTKKAYGRNSLKNQKVNSTGEIELANNQILNQDQEIDVKEKWLDTLKDLNVCSKKGLIQMFDSSIGAATVTMPLGGKYQLTPIQTMVAKLPVLEGKCNTVTMMSYGFDPYLSSWSPFHGAVYAIISSVAKITASGGDYKKIRFTFQEYFRKLGKDPERWGEPLTALLGAYSAQMNLELPSIGGKDSMSGTFNNIDVPPTLVSFAVTTGKVQDVVSPELKNAGNVLIRFPIQKDQYHLPDYEYLKILYHIIHTLSQKKVLQSAYALGGYGLVEAISKMAFGNQLGVKISETVSQEELFAPAFGDIIAEIKEAELNIQYKKIGTVISYPEFQYCNNKITMEEALTSWNSTLEKVFPTHSNEGVEKIAPVLYQAKNIYVSKERIAKPRVFIPVFPGTNCEYDSRKAFEHAGASVKTAVFKNLNAEHIRDSIEAFETAINDAQILMFPGGFSAGDEPDGSGKFIATIFRNERIKEAVNNLLTRRDGLILGICNGFQALIKLGLVPYGEIMPQLEDSPTLTSNNIGRHISKSVYTKVVSNKSPWLQKAQLEGIYTIPASHGEGKFVASKEWIDKLIANGQIATQYVDLDGNPTMEEDFNPNGSYYAIEGITSPDGRVLGKMTHSERRGDGVGINIRGEQNQHIFESGINYFQ
jgi:phosphoribosylformylglycinamidine synthase